MSTVNLNQHYPIGKELYFLIRNAADPRDGLRLCIYQRDARVRKAVGSTIADLLLSNVPCDISNVRYLVHKIQRKMRSLPQYNLISENDLRKLPKLFEPKKPQAPSPLSRKRQRDRMREKTRVRISPAQQLLLTTIRKHGKLYARACGRYAWWDGKLFRYVTTQPVDTLLRKNILIKDQQGFVHIKEENHGTE